MTEEKKYTDEFQALEDPFGHLPSDNGSWLWKDSLVYVLCFMFIFFILGMSTVVFTHYKYDGTSEDERLLLSPQGKLEHFFGHYQSYDAIVYGDSRAYIGIDPSILSEELGMRVFNYASMAHWFQTQYPQLKHMAPKLSGKTVFWMIGDINFSKGMLDDGVNVNGDLSVIDFFEYLYLGYEWKDIFENMVAYFFPNNFLFVKKDAVLSRFNNLMARPVTARNEEHQESLGEGVVKRNIAEIVKAYYLDFFNYSLVSGKNGQNVLISVKRKNGQNPHIEIDSDYLRSKQLEWENEVALLKEFPEDARLREIFSRMLALFKKNHVNLIVIEYKDAPYKYKLKENRELFSNYMEPIRQQVVDEGFKYVRMEMSGYKNSDYFDYDHLNARASKRFSYELAQQIKKTMSRE